MREKLEQRSRADIAKFDRVSSFTLAPRSLACAGRQRWAGGTVLAVASFARVLLVNTPRTLARFFMRFASRFVRPLLRGPASIVRNSPREAPAAPINACRSALNSSPCMCSLFCVSAVSILTDRHLCWLLIHRSPTAVPNDVSGATYRA